MSFHRLLYFILCIGIFMSCEDESSEFGLANTFVKFYGDINENTGTKALTTADGGYIILGHTVFGDTSISAHLFKTDLLGNEEWSLVVDTTTFNTAKDMIVDTDGSYLLLLDRFDVINGNRTNYDIKLIRVSAAGEVVATTVFDSDGLGTFNENGNGLTKAADGGYFIIGSTNNTTGGDLDMYVMKLDASLTMVWDRVYGNVNDLVDVGRSLIEESSGNLIWLGTEQVGLNNTRVRMVKTNALGNILWDFNYPIVENNTVVNGISQAGGMIALNDGYVLTGSHSTRGIVLVKVNTNGQSQWFRQFAQAGNAEGRAITLATDNTIVIGGKATAGDFSNMLLIKTDIQGAVIWSNTFGGAGGNDMINAVAATANGGVILTGSITFDANQMISLTKTNRDGITSE